MCPKTRRITALLLTTVLCAGPAARGDVLDGRLADALRLDPISILEAGPQPEPPTTPVARAATPVPQPPADLGPRKATPIPEPPNAPGPLDNPLPGFPADGIEVSPQPSPPNTPHEHIAAPEGIAGAPFQEFEYRLQPVFGFCPPVDQVDAATIVVEPNGDYLLFMSVLSSEGGLSGADTPWSTPNASYFSVELPPRVLSLEETARVDAAFAEVLAAGEVSNPLLDPCTAREIRWDGRRLFGPFRPADPVHQLLESLRLPLDNGDVNADGERDLTDAIQLLDALFRGSSWIVPAPCGTRCAVRNGDTNGDGTTDVSDALRLLAWLFADHDEPVRIQ